MGEWTEEIKEVAAKQKPAVSLKKTEIAFLEKVLSACEGDGGVSREKYWLPISHAFGNAQQRAGSPEKFKDFRREQVVEGFAFLLRNPYEPVRGVYRELREGLKASKLPRNVSVYHRMLRDLYFDGELKAVDCQLRAYRESLVQLSVPRMIDCETVLDTLTNGLMMRFNLQCAPESYATLLLREKRRALGEIMVCARAEMSLGREKEMESYLKRAEELVKTNVLHAAGMPLNDWGDYKETSLDIIRARAEFASASKWATREV